MDYNDFSVLLTFFLISTTFSQACTTTQVFPNNKLYDYCSDLSQLSSSLFWSYSPSNSKLFIAFVAPPAKSDGWISWSINPRGNGMVGTQSLVAFKDANGVMVVKTFDLKGYRDIVPGNLSFDVTEMSADNLDGKMRIFAALQLPEDLGTTVKHVWQVGSSVSNNFPAVHDFGVENLHSKGTLNLLHSSSGSRLSSSSRNQNIHGILNAVSWGFMFPIGIIIARYVKNFPSADPAWFYLHVICQCSGYILGVAGWGTGMRLGSQSEGVIYSTHRRLGITLFTLATIQVFALFLRPNKNDKFRCLWKIYHYITGYAIIIIGIVNVFKGLDILQPQQKCRTAYIGVTIALGALAAILEVIKWSIWLKNKMNL